MGGLTSITKQKAIHIGHKMIRGGEDHLGNGWNRILSRPRSGGGFKFAMRDMHSFIIAATYYTVRDPSTGSASQNK